MARGFKVADVYAELSLDRDAARDALRGTPAALGADADRAGRELGKKMSDGLARAVEANSAKLVKARRAEQSATDAVKLAEVRLQEARDKGGQKASTLLALEQKLEQSQRRLADAQSATVASTRRLEDAQKKLATSMADVDRDLGPRAQRSGEDAGGKLALGMRMSLIRNSPLIVAAAGGILAAGAPAVLAGATGLFAGIGILAAAQSEKVGHAWSTTWGMISSNTVKAASVIEPTLIKVADNVGDSFQRMRPRVEDAFAASAPQIEVFSDGLIGLAENALPGLERAVERGMPVTQGLADFLEKTGTGLTDFLDGISSHAPAAGRVLSGLGDTMDTLLPMLGELLGQGAELAADVLPLLNGPVGLGGLLSVTRLLGPALPAIGAGLMGMKVSNLVTTGIGTLATKLDLVAARGGAMSGIAGKVSGGLSGIAGSAGAAAAGVGYVAVVIEQWNQLAEKSAEMNLILGQAMHVGGSQAEAAGRQFDQGDKFSRWIPDAIENMNFLGHSIGDMIPTAENAGEAYDKWTASLGASGAASAEVALRQQDLDLQMRNYGAGSKEVERAARELTAAQQAQTQAQADLQMATEGVTDAMLAQADAAMGLANSDLAHRNAVDAAEDSLKAYNDAISKYGASSEEASDAARAWESDLSRVVATAGQLASDALPANMDANSKLALSQIAQRDALRELAAQYGEKLPPALQQALASLEATTAGYDLATLEADRVAAATGTATEKMQKLGATEAVPKIKAESSIFEGVHAATDQKLKQLDAAVATPKAKLDSSVFAGAHTKMMGDLGLLAAQHPTPAAFLNSGPFSGTYNSVLGWIAYIGGQRPTPAVGLADGASGGISKIAQKLASLQDRTIYVTTVERTVKGKAGGGPIYAAVGRKVQGAGGPTDDLVRAAGPGGTDYRLSPGEWIVNAWASSQQGDSNMAALNSGQADIVPRSGRTALASSSTASVDDLTAQLFAAMSSGVDDGVGVASPELTRSVLRAAPQLTVAVRSAAPQLTGAVENAGPVMTASIAAAGPTLTNAISVAAGSLSNAIRNALIAGGWRGDPTDGSETLYAPAGGSKVQIYDSSRANDPTYMAWWEGLKAAGWKGHAGDGVEALYAPGYARGGRFAAGQLMKVGEEGEELVRFDQGGTVIPAGKTRELMAAGRGRSIHIEHLDVHLQGFDIRDRGEIRRFARALRQELLAVDREDS